MSDVLIVENNIVNILEIDESQILVIEDRSVELLTIGEQGPQGIPGPSGSGIAGDVPVIVSDTEPVIDNCLWLQTGLGDNGEDFTMWLKEPD